MYRIAICDDDYLVCNELEEYLQDFFKLGNQKCEIEIFHSGEGIKKYLQQGNDFDILFLDIELGGVNGVEVGEYIRSGLNNDNMLIVYISSKSKYALELFKICTFEFLIKPITNEQLSNVITRATEKIDKKNKYFRYASGKTFGQIKLADIFYFRSELRKIHIISNGSQVDFYGKLNDEVKDIPDDIFLRIHHSYVVNMEHVISYSYDHITLSNNEQLAISKSYRKTVREKLLQVRGVR